MCAQKLSFEVVPLCLLNSVLKLLCARAFQLTPMPSIPPNLFRVVGEPMQACKMHSHAGSHRRVVVLVTEMGSAPINPVWFS